jgi:hypothetical protein
MVGILPLEDSVMSLGCVCDDLVDRCAVGLAQTKRVDKNQLDGADQALLRIGQRIKKWDLVVLADPPRE